MLRTADIQDIIGDLKYDLEVEGNNLGLKRLQHHDVVTIGYIHNVITQINTREWTKILKNALNSCLHYKPELSLKSSKIYGADFNATKKPSQFRILSRPSPKKMDIHIETIGPQKDSVRRGLTNILPKLDKHLCGLELHFIPVLSYKTDNNLTHHLRNVAVKHDQITSDICSADAL